MNPELRQSSMSLSKSFTRYLSPQTTEKTNNQGYSNIAYPSARETIGLTQSAILSKNEHVIPLDLQYTVTKKVEVSNYSDYEVRIQTLQHESELWRKRYLEMMAKSDKNIANLEIIALQEQRIQLLLRENAELNGKLKAALTENEQLRLEQYNIELQYSINRENSGQELSEQLNRRNNEIRDWKEKYTQIEQQLTQYQTLDIDLGEAQTKNKILQLSIDQWQQDYWKLVDERKKYLSQEVPEENTEQLRQLLTELKVKESDLNNLSHKIRVLEREIELIKKQNLQQETEILDLEGVLSAEKLKNSKLNEQIIKFQISIQNKQNEINNLDNEILRLHGLDEEVENLDREIKDLQSIINTKDDDNNKLRREISRLETTNQELKHEKLQKSQVEIEFKQQQEQLQNLFNLYNEKKNSFDQLKIKYGSLEIDNSQYKARIEELKYEQIQLLQLESENKNLLNRIQYLESIQKQLQQEVLELSTKLQEIKILEIDNKTQQELIQLKDIEIAQLRKRVTQYEIQPKNDTNDLERQLRLQQQIIDKLQNEIKVKQAEIDRYFQLNQKLQYQITQNEIGQEFNFESKQSDSWQPGAQEQQIEVLQHTNAELESNIAFLTSQISNLQKQILSRKQEVEDWRRQAGQNYVEATESKRIISELQTIGQQLQNENQQLLKQVEDLDSKSKQATLKQQQSALQLNQEQLKLNGQINSLKQDLQKTQIELKFSKKDSEKNKENYLRAEQQNMELRQLEEKYNYQVQKSDLLSQDNQRLNQLLRETPTNGGDAEFNDENQIKLIKLQERNDKLTQENVEVSSQIRILEQKLADKDFGPLEQKIQILQKENQRVDLAYRNKLRDAEELRNRCNALEQTIVDLKYLEKRVPDLSSRIQSLEIGLRDAQQALTLSNSEQEKLNQKIVKQELQLKEYGFLQREHAALQSQYKQNQQETQQLRTKIYLQEQEIENYQVQSVDLTKKYQQLTNEFKNQKDALAERNRDAEKLLIRLQKAELSETQLAGLQKQIKALELQSSKQAIEITEQQHIAQTAKNQQLLAQQLNDKLNFENLQLIPYRNKVNELQFIIKRDQELIQQTNIEIAQLKKERDNIQQQSQQEINLLTQKNDQLTIENKQVRDLQQLVNQDNEQINDLIKQNNQLQQEIFAVRLQNNSLVERIRKYEVIEQDFQKLKEVNDRQSEQLRQLKAQVQQLESDKNNFLNIKNSLEQRVAMLASEIERQSYKVNVKNNELEKTQEQLKGLQQALQESQQFEGEFRSADDAVIKLRQELEQLKSQLVRQQKEYDEIRQQKDILEGKTQNSQGEYEQVRSRLQRSEQEKEQLILEIQKLQNDQINRSTNNELQANVNTQIQLNEQLQQQLQVKNQELIKIKQGVSDLESDIQQLRQTQLDGQKLQIQIMTFNKEKEEWHQKLDQLQRSIENLEKQKLELQGVRAILIADNDSAKQKLSIAIQEKRLQQDQVNNFKEETDRLNQQLQDAYQEIEELRKRQSMLQGSFMGGQLTNSMTEEELRSLTLEENLTEQKRAIHILTKGVGVQKLAIYSNLKPYLFQYIKEDIFNLDDETLEIVSQSLAQIALQLSPQDQLTLLQISAAFIKQKNIWYHVYQNVLDHTYCKQLIYELADSLDPIQRQKAAKLLSYTPFIEKIQILCSDLSVDVKLEIIKTIQVIYNKFDASIFSSYLHLKIIALIYDMDVKQEAIEMFFTVQKKLIDRERWITNYFFEFLNVTAPYMIKLMSRICGKALQGIIDVQPNIARFMKIYTQYCDSPFEEVRVNFAYNFAGIITLLNGDYYDQLQTSYLDSMINDNCQLVKDILLASVSDVLKTIRHQQKTKLIQAVKTQLNNPIIQGQLSQIFTNCNDDEDKTYVNELLHELSRIKINSTIIQETIKISDIICASDYDTWASHLLLNLNHDQSCVRQLISQSLAFIGHHDHYVVNQMKLHLKSNKFRMRINYIEFVGQISDICSKKFFHQFYDVLQLSSDKIFDVRIKLGRIMQKLYAMIADDDDQTVQKYLQAQKLLLKDNIIAEILRVDSNIMITDDQKREQKELKDQKETIQQLPRYLSEDIELTKPKITSTTRQSSNRSLMQHNKASDLILRRISQPPLPQNLKLLKPPVVRKFQRLKK